MMASPRLLARRVAAATLIAVAVSTLSATPAFAAPTATGGLSQVTEAPVAGDGLRLEGASNFRDVGGYRTADGRTVRTGLVYRSNKLSDLTDEDLRKISAAGITRDVDLRNAQEREEDPDRLPAGVRYQVADVESLEHGVWFHTSVPDTLVRSLMDAQRNNSSNIGQSVGYPFMVDFHGADVAFHDLLAAIARGHGALVFHCTAGKDRTGWGTAILLSILGVPRSTIEADFLKSNAYLDRENAVESSWLDAAFDEVHRLYGDMDTYVRRGLNLDPATVSALRARLLT
ncbi:MAG: tyrosine-protein phosphatase [Gordonia sp. (in: high G+C Gram-positive bacteria)]|uniref:tyrosine-protein phosphatase n=1 Tax=Gordonia sp. (in: high G+C Gram-positive bacteria) TaxID=84139 RepID=UPI0039E686CA